MIDNSTDLRRLFRNRFEWFVDTHDSSASVGIDGSPLTLRDLCKILRRDEESFPTRYDPDMKKLCGHEFVIWLRKPRTYSDAARIVDRLLAAKDGSLPRPGGMWVHAILKSEAPVDASAR